MHLDLAALLPGDKTDTERAEDVIALGFPRVEPILPAMLEWMQDFNWPVAQTFQPFLASIGAPLAPHVRRVLKTTDETWKYWVLRCIVAESTDLSNALAPELNLLASAPTAGEQQEELDRLARAILETAK